MLFCWFQLAITNHQISLDWIAFNKDFYDGMSDEDRAVLDEACAAFIEAEREAYIASELADIATLEENGVEVTYPDRTEFKEAGSAVIDEYCDLYPEFKEMVELIRTKQ